jgi:hypothetical protein
VFVWFAAVSVLVVLLVFNSPTVDHRLVALGAVLPVAEAALGGPFLLHTLVGSVGLFVLVVVVARGRRLLARRLVGLPIGTFLHLVLDGTWARSDLFWWPFLGGRLGEGQTPEVEHLGVSLLLEAIGVGMAVWIVQREGLVDPERRRAFLRTGRLGGAVAPRSRPR